MYIDSVVEWKLLASLFRENGEKILPRVSDVLFTDERSYVFEAIKKAVIKYPKLTYDGLRLCLGGDLPGELTAVPASTDAYALLDECIRLATKRELDSKARELSALAKEFNPKPEKISAIFKKSPHITQHDSLLTHAAGELLQETLAKIEGSYKFADTGLPFLNVRMGGEYQPGKLIIFAADAGHGKTTIIANSALRMVYDVDTDTPKVEPVISLTFSLEMSKKDLLIKWAADLLNIDSKHIQSGTLTHRQLEQIEKVASVLQKLPIYVIDNGQIPLFEMIQEIRDHVKRYNVRVVFVDHLQIVNHYNKGMLDDLGEIAQALRDLAKELGITVVLLSQVNRDGEGINCIYGSSIPGKIADVIMRIEIGPQEGISDGRSVLMSFVKNRLGPTGNTSVLFHGAFQRFVSASASYYDNEE